MLSGLKLGYLGALLGAFAWAVWTYPELVIAAGLGMLIGGAWGWWARTGSWRQ